MILDRRKLTPWCFLRIRPNDAQGSTSQIDVRPSQCRKLAPTQTAIPSDEHEQAVSRFVDLSRKPPELIMSQRPRVIALHLGQADTCSRIALDCAVAHGVVEHPAQNAQRMASGRNGLRPRQVSGPGLHLRRSHRDEWPAPESTGDLLRNHPTNLAKSGRLPSRLGVQPDRAPLSYRPVPRCGIRPHPRPQAVRLAPFPFLRITFSLKCPRRYISAAVVDASAIDPRTAGTDTSFNHPACQRDSRRMSSHSSTSRESHRSAVPTRIAGGPSPRRRQARMQPTLTVRRSANSWIVSSVPSGCQSSCGFDCFETAVTFAGIWDAAIVFPLLRYAISWDHRIPLDCLATTAANFAQNPVHLRVRVFRQSVRDQLLPADAAPHRTLRSPHLRAPPSAGSASVQCPRCARPRPIVALTTVHSCRELECREPVR